MDFELFASAPPSLGSSAPDVEICEIWLCDGLTKGWGSKGWLVMAVGGGFSKGLPPSDLVSEDLVAFIIWVLSRLKDLFSETRSGLGLRPAIEMVEERVTPDGLAFIPAKRLRLDLGLSGGIPLVVAIEFWKRLLVRRAEAEF